MKTIKIHEDNIKSIERWDFFNGFPIMEKRLIWNWIYECNVEFNASWYETYSC